MKRKCKNIDISDPEYIRNCIELCMSKKDKKAWNRPDVKEYWADHDWNIDIIAQELSNEIKTRTVTFPPVKMSQRLDRSNEKMRLITIENIKQQYYDYIAYNGLEELASRLGEYQIACQPGKGPIWGARIIQGWMQSKDIKYAIKADIQKCYPSITHQNMMKWLNRHVKNDQLIYLIEQLINSIDEGLPIGSYLSIRLCGLYMSDLYHHIGGTYFTTRRGKKINTVAHVMLFMDDIYIFGSNARQMHKAMSGTLKFAHDEMGLTIKPSWRIIDLNPAEGDAHIDCMGYRIYRDRITMRHRDYVKTKKSVREFKGQSNLHNARCLAAYHGLFVKVTDSIRFSRKYNVYKYFKKARRLISKYDKSRFLTENGSGSNNRHHKQPETVSAVSK